MDIKPCVYIDDNELVIDNALKWCTENNILVLKYNVRHSENSFGRGMIYGFDFFFANMEDATAFKLRWG